MNDYHKRPDGTWCGYLAKHACNKCGWVDGAESTGRMVSLVLIVGVILLVLAMKGWPL